MTELEKALRKIQLKDANHMNITSDLAIATAYMVGSDDFDALPEFYIPENCHVNDPYDRLKNKIVYLRRQLEIYQNVDSNSRIKQLEYIAAISITMLDDGNVIYINMNNGIPQPSDDARYKKTLFFNLGGNQAAFISGAEQLLDDLETALDNLPIDIYFAANNLAAFMIDAYTELSITLP